MSHYTFKAGLLACMLALSYTLCAQNTGIEVPVSTFLGNGQRNYYGNVAPEKLDTLWSFYLGEGISPAYGNPNKLWKGAGWTGQPLVVVENGRPFLIQGAFDYHLKKIDAQTGQIVWQYAFDDILKGTGTIWHNPQAKNTKEEYIVMQGSRRGVKNWPDAPHCESFRAVSLLTGEELWRMDVRKTHSYSRDCDASALVVSDTAYIPLENGIFTILDPNPALADKNKGQRYPFVFQELWLYEHADTLIHGAYVESESSPCVLGNRIYITAGSGRVYGYNRTTRCFDWVFEIGSDLNGSPVVTSDSCLLIPVEKEFITGRGGVFKINPALPPEQCVVWFMPVADYRWFHWQGGIVGSVAINDSYVPDTVPHLAAFVATDGYLYVVDHRTTEPGNLALGPDSATWYPSPRTVYKEWIGPTISTPIFTSDKLIAALDNGLFLYAYDACNHFSLLDHLPGIQADATPTVWDGKLYLATFQGYMLCLGKKE